MSNAQSASEYTRTRCLADSRRAVPARNKETAQPCCDPGIGRARRHATTPGALNALRDLKGSVLRLAESGRLFPAKVYILDTARIADVEVVTDPQSNTGFDGADQG